MNEKTFKKTLGTGVINRLDLFFIFHKKSIFGLKDKNKIR